MTKIIKDKLDLKIEICDSVDLKVNSNYLLINLKTNEISIHIDETCCFFCKTKELENDFLNFKGVCICKDCLEEIKKGESGNLIY